MDKILVGIIVGVAAVLLLGRLIKGVKSGGGCCSEKQGKPCACAAARATSV